MFNPSNPATWTPRECRSDAGTLLCICGSPGRDFYSDGTELIAGKLYGVLRGACCEEHHALYRRHTRPEEYLEQAQDWWLEPEPASEPTPVSGFGPLFATLRV